MLKNYFLLALRNMQKNKLHTAINISGMTVAFTCSIFILLLVYREFSFDGFHPNKDRIFEVYQDNFNADGEQLGSSMSYLWRRP